MSDFLFPALLVAEWHPSLNGEKRLTDFSPGSGYKAWWLCEKHDYSYSTRISHRIAGSGCPVCSGNKILPGFNDFQSLFPALAKQFSPNNLFTPDSIGPGSTKKALWYVKECGHSWEQLVISRTRRKDASSPSCSVCSGNILVTGANDLETRFPDIATQWHPTKNGTLTPSSLSPGSGRMVWWQCKEGHEWEAEVRSRTGRDKAGCLVCSHRVVLPGVNDFKTLYPELADQWHPEKNLPLTPGSISGGVKKKVVWVCEKGHEWTTYIYNRTGSYKKGCRECANHVSKAETSLASYVGDLIEIQRNTRTIIPPQELDIYVPSKGIAIEFNGIFWHSEMGGKGKFYHHDKWKACQEKDIQLIQIWEDDWERNPTLIRNMLRYKLGLDTTDSIPARKLTIAAVSRGEAYEFLVENHIQGYVASSYYLGLHKGEALVALLCLKEKKVGDTEELEITRYATSQRVPGGFTRLLKYTSKTYDTKIFTTFSDNMVSDGNLYRSNGFLAVKHLPPDYFYLYQNQRVHKFNFRLKRFRDDPSLKYVEGLTETQLAELNDLPRIWDAGKVKWELQVT